MRSKKTREVNIFSASVVDLFASGLGVFLIVSIIALVNQKKEVSRLQTEHEAKIEGLVAGKFDEGLGGTADPEIKKKNELIQSLQTKIKMLVKLKEKSGTKVMIQEKFIVADMEIKHEKERQRLKGIIEELKRESSSLKRVTKAKEEKILALQKQKAKSFKGQNYETFGIGSKITLESVHFYPGTIMPIEPYASMEIEKFANYMHENIKVTVEISGHVFITKKEILNNQAQDESNLSGRRAGVVCDKLIDFGINGKRLNCVGYGASRYLYLTNDSYSKEAQLNRRVEVEILSK